MFTNDIYIKYKKFFFFLKRSFQKLHITNFEQYELPLILTNQIKH